MGQTHENVTRYWGAITFGIVSTLNEIIIGKVQALRGISNLIPSNIGVKQGCPLSPTLFGLYIDEISDYIARLGGPALA